MLRGDDRPFALIGAWAGGGALLGSEPVAGRGARRRPVRAARRRARRSRGDADAVGGGWFGFLGFEARHRVERGHPPPPRPVPLPDGALAYYDHVVRLRRRRALVVRGARHARARGRARAPPRRSSPRGSPTRRRRGRSRPRDWRWTPSPARPRRGASRRAASGSAAGDLFQANLCLRLEGRLEGDAFDLFATAAAALPTDRAAFVAGPWGTVASLSPELFLTRTGRTVRSAPIKGTRPADRRAELEASAKDRAENVMIVDLVRNDLGRVCRPGTVRVTALAEARPHAGVWHLVSEVEGELRDGVGDADLLRATFPPGSVTGAPKLAALDVIAELESTGREAYTGAIGFASPLAGLELSVAIRTFEIRGTRIWLGAGGGIVADSDGRRRGARGAGQGRAAARRDRRREPPDAARRGQSPSRAARRAARPPADAAARPGGRAVRDDARRRRARRSELDAHLARLAASLRALYRLAPPPDLAARAAAAARGHGRARLRIDVVPGEDATIHGHAARRPRSRSCCAPSSSPAGSARTSGATARCSRRTRPTTRRRCRCCSTPTARAGDEPGERRRSATRGGALHTPPADGRILPGVTVAGSRRPPAPR